MIFFFLKKICGHYVSLQDLASNGINGSFHQKSVTMRNKGKEQRANQKSYEIDLDDFCTEYKNTYVSCNLVDVGEHGTQLSPYLRHGPKIPLNSIKTHHISHSVP